MSHPDQRVSTEEKQTIIDWITENANRYWFSEGGPLLSPEEGGADVVMVSDMLPRPRTPNQASPSSIDVPRTGDHRVSLVLAQVAGQF